MESLVYSAGAVAAPSRSAIVPWRRKSVSMLESCSSLATYSGKILALSMASGRMAGGVAGSLAASMPAAAEEDSLPGTPWSRTSTLAPRSRSSRARDTPMMPAPAIITSHEFTSYIVKGSVPRQENRATGRHGPGLVCWAGRTHCYPPAWKIPRGVGGQGLCNRLGSR